MSEIEARARDYGLPTIQWPSPYPANSLSAMRAAVWATERAKGRESHAQRSPWRSSMVWI